MMTSDTGNIEAGTEFDMRIAERLGWKITDLNDNSNGLRVKGPNWHVLSPQGYVAHGWRRYEAILKAGVPPYSRDLNAAFTLKVEGARLTVRQWPDNDHWLAEYYKIKGSHGMGCEADTPALAICRAWLAWQDMKGEEA